MPSRRSARVFFLATALLPAAAHAGLFDDEEARSRIEQLRQENNARFEKIETTSARGQIELANSIESLKQELAKLRGQVELLTHEIEEAKKRQKDFYIDLDVRLRKIEQAAVQPQTEKPAGAAADPAAEARDYEVALNLFKAAKYKEALAAFDAFRKTYPDGGFAASALYWSGQALYQLRDCRKAVESFQKVSATWPNDPKAPDAMLGTAICQQELGDARAGRATLESLVARYPASAAATIARERLGPHRK